VCVFAAIGVLYGYGFVDQIKLARFVYLDTRHVRFFFNLISAFFRPFFDLLFSLLSAFFPPCGFDPVVSTLFFRSC